VCLKYGEYDCDTLFHTNCSRHHRESGEKFRNFDHLEGGDQQQLHGECLVNVDNDDTDERRGRGQKV